MMIRIGLALVWCLHFLPLRVLAPIGRGLGVLFYLLAIERRHVVMTNLRLCFPQWSNAECKAVAQEHFKALGRSVVEHGLLWWSSKERIQRLVRVEGLHHWQAVAQSPVIWFAPHFVGLDMGGARITTQWHGVSVYSHQKNPIFDRVLLMGRKRFISPVLFSRQDGIRPVVKAIKKGLPFYYLPDMDFGEKDSLFVPFFGVDAATITGLSRLAHLAKAVVVPVVTEQLPGDEGYVLKFFPAWENFPSQDLLADTRRMNAFIEERVRELPAQYYWVHKRFKTRPKGEPSVYAKT